MEVSRRKLFGLFGAAAAAPIAAKMPELGNYPMRAKEVRLLQAKALSGAVVDPPVLAVTRGVHGLIPYSSTCFRTVVQETIISGKDAVFEIVEDE